MFKILRFITILTAKLSATEVGRDEFGNVYYQHNSKKTSNGKLKRFCLYNGTPESSRVPPVFHAWLHYSNDDIGVINFLPKYSWLKKHKPNLTGTVFAWLPKRNKVKQQHYREWKPKKS